MTATDLIDGSWHTLCSVSYKMSVYSKNCPLNSSLPRRSERRGLEARPVATISLSHRICSVSYTLSSRRPLGEGTLVCNIQIPLESFVAVNTLVLNLIRLMMLNFSAAFRKYKWTMCPGMCDPGFTPNASASKGYQLYSSVPARF